ncbi:MAG: asparagine synthase (glutamine-hydrolyzing) [Desulfobacterales bacterium]
MCGIAGLIHFSSSAEQWQDSLKRISDTLTHRGPDDEGIWFDAKEGIGLCHRRLSIIDLSKEGRQPMISHSGRYVISYNGEVYNFHELRHELAKEDIPWRGYSDTEVMLAAIEKWGLEPAVNRFIGMFAFALFDRKEKELILCRDRVGIKPVYYARINKGLIFGSELKALMAYPDFTPVIDRDALALYFRHNCIPAPYCIYRDAWKLKPGHILKIPLTYFQEKKELPQPSCYWHIRQIVEAGQNKTTQIHPAEAVKELETLLRDSVKMRMISDVPLGAFLSGGIDSSMVVALMQEQSGRKVKTFSIGFHEEGYNEAEYAKQVANYLGADHTELYVSPREAMNVIPDLPYLYDEPFSDSSQIPTCLLSRLTREFVTVSLSGDGGDELFGGYNRYFWGRNIQKFSRFFPLSLRNLAARGLKAIPPFRWDSFLYRILSCLPRRYRMDTPGDRIHKFAQVIQTRTPEEMYRCMTSHWLSPENLVRQSREPATIVTDLNLQPELDDYTSKMMYLDLATYLPDDILTKIDRASMGVGLESRVPLLDHRVVEYAWNLPLSMKIRGNQGKWILRQVLYKHLPRELIERPKTGFSIPIDSWLRGPLKEWAEELLDEDRLKSEDILNPVLVRNAWKDHLSRKQNLQYPLWDVLMFQAWKEQHTI